MNFKKISTNKMQNLIEIVILIFLIIVYFINLKVGYLMLVSYFIIFNTISFLKIGGKGINITNWFLYVALIISGGHAVQVIVNKSFDKFDFIGLLFVSIIIVGIKIMTKNIEIRVNFRMKKNSFYRILITVFIVILASFIIPAFLPGFLFIKKELIYASAFSICLLTAIYSDRKIVFFLIAGISFLVFYLTFFKGFGRINIMTLVSGFLFIYVLKFKPKNIKMFLILIIIPGIITASLMRGGSLDDLFGGIESIIAPQKRFNQLLEMVINKEVDYFNGKTFYAALVTPIPREWWPNKPWNFNREVTYIFSPEKVAYGHSDVGSIFGEFLLNFSYIGLFIMPFIFSKIFNLFEKNKIKISKKIIDEKVFLNYIISLIFLAGIMDIYWGGPSTFMSRGGFRIILFFIFYSFTMIFIKKINFVKEEVIK